MLSTYNAIDIEAALRAVTPPPNFAPAGDRQAWAAIRKQAGEKTVSDIITRAEQAAQAAIPGLPATLWLEFVRNGQREGFQEPRSKRRIMMSNLALAEAIEGKGRFLDALLNVVWAICEESSWSLPAHQRTLTDMERHHIDLGVAGTALELAEVDALLGAQLDPLLGRRIRYEVNQRCFIPYLTRHDHWWLYNTNERMVNNWTAVCNAGVVGAAIYLEPDLSRLAEMIARAARSLDDYLATFDADGGSTEGPGYWSYGFGHFSIIAQLVEQRTGGVIDFWCEEVARKAAVFPLHTALTTDAWTNFSDCDRTIRFIPGHLTYLAKRLDAPELMKLARTQPAPWNGGTWAVRNLVWQPEPAPSGTFVPGKHDWYPGMMWMIGRINPADANALVLAAKGGHNEEMHNQNDVGNIIVHIGNESVIPDIGRGRYTKAYFGPERYQHLVNSSRGHSVPVVNGQEQCAGLAFAAQLLDHHSSAALDSMTIEMKDAYPASAGLASLKRTVALHRDTAQGWVELIDEVHFSGDAGQCDSVLTTFSDVTITASVVTLQGQTGALRVSFDPAVVKPAVVVEKDVDLALGPADVKLVTFSLLTPAKDARIRLVIEPV